jgi:methyl-accepting chemotaxis protein
VSATTALLAVLLVAASALCGVGIWALIESVRTARSLRQLADDLDVRLVPLLDKADVTVDATNAELLRIDQIVTRVEEVTDRLSDTSRAVQEVANAPAEIVNELAERLRRAWKTRKQPHYEQPDSPTSSAGDTEVPVPVGAPEETSPQ